MRQSVGHSQELNGSTCMHVAPVVSKVHTCHNLAVNAICVLKADTSVINAVSIHTVASTTLLDWWRAAICWTTYRKTGRVRLMCSSYYMSNACMQLAISYCFIALLTLCYICRSASKCTQYEYPCIIIRTLQNHGKSKQFAVLHRLTIFTYCTGSNLLQIHQHTGRFHSRKCHH